MIRTDVSFSDIIIETRRFSEHWWGAGEPIAITAVDRKDGVTVGKIKNVRFENITCVSENGIFIHGNKNKPVEEISFENVKIHLRNISHREIANYDLRPCASDGKGNSKNERRHM